ncbi:MAG: hypothetical protein ABH969_01405 [Pseudomonadota bacterium]
MKKMIFLGCLILFLAPIVWAQEKVEAPVWNVGDKWEFGREGFLEGVRVDAKGYVANFSAGIFYKSAQGTAIFDKSTLNILYVLEGDKAKKYRGSHRRILNFPLVIGKKWKDSFFRVYKGGWYNADCLESFIVLGWEDVQVRAGKFKTLKFEYTVQESRKDSFIAHSPPRESKAWYWYSPEVKYLVKGKYEKEYSEDFAPWDPAFKGGREGWELTSFQLKK